MDNRKIRFTQAEKTIDLDEFFQLLAESMIEHAEKHNVLQKEGECKNG